MELAIGGNSTELAPQAGPPSSSRLETLLEQVVINTSKIGGTVSRLEEAHAATAAEVAAIKAKEAEQAAKQAKTEEQLEALTQRVAELTARKRKRSSSSSSVRLPERLLGARPASVVARGHSGASADVPTQYDPCLLCLQSANRHRLAMPADAMASHSAADAIIYPLNAATGRLGEPKALRDATLAELKENYDAFDKHMADNNTVMLPRHLPDDAQAAWSASKQARIPRLIRPADRAAVTITWGKFARFVESREAQE